MAPEILLHSPYDPQKTDVWSLAIMYCSMILGRFPWKAPALYDEAFRLFATTRSRNSHAERGMGRRSTEPPLLQASNSAAVAPCDSEARNTDTLSMININLNEAANIKATEVDSEPCRLLRQLPIESRTVIRKMFLLNADNRPTLEQIKSYPWIQLGQLFSPGDGGAMHYGYRHEHVLRHGVVPSS
jgi:serine/threonine protein kinase